jgi:glucuronate isomerase
MAAMVHESVSLSLTPTLAPDRFFDPEPQHKRVALDLFAGIERLPIVSPHGHVDPALFADPDYHFGNPVALLVQPDHYLLRMLYSQGVPYAQLLSGEDPRRVWQLFAENFHLFRATPSGLWFVHVLAEMFDIHARLDGASAQHIYGEIEAALMLPSYQPRALFDRMNIAVLATTDAATDTLAHHRAIRSSGWSGRIVPTFRPDAVINLQAPNWRENIATLGELTGESVGDYRSYIRAIEQRRTAFRALGATATDVSAPTPLTGWLTEAEAAAIFARALAGAPDVAPDAADTARFTAHMLCELARMSVDDGLVMQLHCGVARNHNPAIFAQFGPDRGFDIPLAAEFTRSLKPLLDSFGNHPKLTLILFTLDEAVYARELAPLAGAYPALRLGPPWWFHDSWNGMRRYFDQVIETAGIYNTAGFNDDTRAFLSIPARHDLWRRASANWLAGLVTRGILNFADAQEIAAELAGGLARRAYRL